MCGEGRIVFLQLIADLATNVRLKGRNEACKGLLALILGTSEDCSEEMLKCISERSDTRSG